MRQEIRLAGFGGQGIISLGIIIASAAGKFEGKQVAQTQSYGPEARGGACKTEVVISDLEIDYIKALNPNVLLVMSQPSLDKYVADIDPEKALLIFDSTLVEKVPENIKHRAGLPATQMADEQFKTRLTANIIMFGALAKISGLLTYDACRKAMAENLPEKVLEKNLAAFDAGYGYSATAV
jgi:2-oxoglutarate ferredoxin oxidoreductase subunit gamma